MRLNIVMEELPNWSCNDYSKNVVMNSQFDLSDVWNCKAATCVKFVHSPLGGHTHSGNKELCLFCDDDVNEFRQMASKRLKTGRPWKLHPTIHSSINSIHPCICYVSAAAAYLQYVYLRHNGIHARNIYSQWHMSRRNYHTVISLSSYKKHTAWIMNMGCFVWFLRSLLFCFELISFGAQRCHYEDSMHLQQDLGYCFSRVFANAFWSRSTCGLKGRYPKDWSCAYVLPHPCFNVSVKPALP